MTRNFAARVLPLLLLAGVALSRVAPLSSPNQYPNSNAAATYTPAWSVQVKPEINPESAGLPYEVVLARERHFKQFFTSNIDNPKKANIGSRTYIMHKPVGAFPIGQSNTIVLATPSDNQPYFAENRSAVFTDLRLSVDKYMFRASGVPDDATISILYSGGMLRSTNGTIVRTALVSGITPLELSHRYLLFLNYAEATRSFSVVRVWDLTSSRPELLDEDGAISSHNAELKIANEGELEARVTSDLASRPTSPQ